MRLLKRLSGYFGLSRDQHGESPSPYSPSPSPSASTPTQTPTATLPPFSSIHRVPVARTPILVPCTSIQGGVQGLRWFARRLKIDEDGDVADEFLEDVLPGIQESMELGHTPVTNIEVKYIVRPAKVRNQMMSPDGKLQHCVENQGRLQWV